MIVKRKSIFDIIKEADDDNQSDVAQNDAESGNDEAPSSEESNESGGDNEFGSDDDFDIDTTVDDEGDDSDEGNDDNSDSDTDLDGGDGGSDDEEVVPANTDIFSSLTAEEQQQKIIELKRLFMNMYSSTDDILEKINNIATDENNIAVINRISYSLYSLRQYLYDYITNIFATKSYIENDIMFNRFLVILNSISVAINEIYKVQSKDQ